MVRIRVPEKDLVLLVMGHLHRTGLIKSLRALEKETVLNLVQYGKDVLFFRDLVMDGRWEEAQLFIEPLKDSAFNHGRVSFFLDRQRFLELADQHCANADVKEMVSALKALEGRCSQEEFHSLCYCLTLPSLKKHPDFGEWDVYRGRLSCFESCLSHLRTVFPDQVPPGDKVQLPGGPNDPLVTMCRQALLFQVQQYRRADASRLLPEELTADVFSETLEGSLARSQPCPSTHPHARTHPRARRSHEQQQLDDVTFQSDVPTTAPASAARSEPLRANGVGGHVNGLQVNGGASATEEVIDGRRSASYAYEERTQSGKAVLPQDSMWSHAAQGPTTNVRRAPGSESERRPQGSNTPASVPCQADDRPAAHASGPAGPPPKPLAWDITFEEGNAPLAAGPPSLGSRPQQPLPRGQDGTAPQRHQQQHQQQASSLPSITRSSSTQSNTSIPPPPPRPNPAANTPTHPAGVGDASALTTMDVPQRHSGTDSVDSQHADGSRTRQDLPQQPPPHPQTQSAIRDNGSLHAPLTRKRRSYRDLEVGDVSKITGGRSLVTDSHPIRAAVLDSSGCRLVFGTNSGALRICDVAAAVRDVDEQVFGEEGGGGGPVTILHERFKHARGSVYSLSWSSDDTLIASGSNDKAVRVLRAVEGAHEGQDVVLQGHTGTVRDVCFSPAGPMLLSAGGGDFALRLWDVSRGRTQSPVTSLKLHSGTVFRSRFASADGHTAVSGGEDGVVAWWDVRSGQSVASLKVPQAAAVQGLAPLMGAGSGGQGEGVMVATSHADGTICVWDRRRVNAPVASLKAFSHDCRAIALSPDGRWLVGGSYDQTIAVLGVSLRGGGDSAAAAQSGVLSSVASRVGHKGKILSMVWHPRLPAFISSGSDGAVMLWNPV